eukprot:908808-Pelagomonas_calceolata.AAC.1
MACFRVRCITWSSWIGWHDEKPEDLDDKALWIAPKILAMPFFPGSIMPNSGELSGHGQSARRGPGAQKQNF